MLKFSFPHLYYDNSVSVTPNLTEDDPTSTENILRGEAYKGYKRDSSFRFIYYDFNFGTTVEYDHVIVKRADLLEAVPTLSYIRTIWLTGAGGYGGVDITTSTPFSYADLYNQDVIMIKPDPTANTSTYGYRFIADWLVTSSKVFSLSKVQISTFFEFDYNPSEWGYTTKSNQVKFNTDLQTEISVEIDYPKRVFSGTWEAISDAQLATFKTRVQQQMADNQYAYCYLYDDSGRNELMGSGLTYVKITKFDYIKDSKKDGTPYNIINLEMEEVRG